MNFSLLNIWKNIMHQKSGHGNGSRIIFLLSMLERIKKKQHCNFRTWYKYTIGSNLLRLAKKPWTLETCFCTVIPCSAVPLLFLKRCKIGIGIFLSMNTRITILHWTRSYTWSQPDTKALPLLVMKISVYTVSEEQTIIISRISLADTETTLTSPWSGWRKTDAQPKRYWPSPHQCIEHKQYKTKSQNIRNA